MMKMKPESLTHQESETEMVLLDVARTQQEFDQCAEILKRTHPEEELPQFGQPGLAVFIVRDNENEPEKVRGCILGRSVFEVRGMAVDPDYKYQDASFTLLHSFTEGNLRVSGHSEYFYVAPKSKEKNIKILKRSGAVPVDEESVRLRKKL